LQTERKYTHYNFLADLQTSKLSVTLRERIQDFLEQGRIFELKMDGKIEDFLKFFSDIHIVYWVLLGL
jgi:hypothetical protein